MVFLGIALDKASRLWAFLGERPFYYKIVPDGLSIAQLYGVQAYPTHWVIDQEGVARLVERGLRLGVDRRLERTIEELLQNDK